MSIRRRILSWLEDIDWLKVILIALLPVVAAVIALATLVLFRQIPGTKPTQALSAAIILVAASGVATVWSRSSAERRRRREEERLEWIRRYLDLLDEVKAVRRLIDGGPAAAGRKQNPRNRPKRKSDGNPGQKMAPDEPAGKVRP